MSLRLSASISAGPPLSAFWSRWSAVCYYCVVSHVPFIDGGCVCTKLVVRIWSKCVFLGEDGGSKSRMRPLGSFGFTCLTNVWGNEGSVPTRRGLKCQIESERALSYHLLLAPTCSPILGILEGRDFISNGTTFSYNVISYPVLQKIKWSIAMEGSARGVVWEWIQDDFSVRKENWGRSFVCGKNTTKS